MYTLNVGVKGLINPFTPTFKRYILPNFYRECISDAVEVQSFFFLSKL